MSSSSKKGHFLSSRNQQWTNLGSKLMGFSFQNPISSGKIPKDFYNIPQMAWANSRVQHINIQQDESIFISWNLIIYQKKKRTKRDIEEINTNALRKQGKENSCIYSWEMARKRIRQKRDLNMPMTTYSEYCYEILEITSWI